MVRTSYGVRFLDSAYLRSIWLQLRSNASSWSPTSSFDVVSSVKSYVAGKRKPSRLGTFFGKSGGGAVVSVTFRYSRSERLGVIWRFSSAILFTAVMRLAISTRV